MARLALLLLVTLLAACSAAYSNPKSEEPVAPGEVRLSWDQVDSARAETDALAALGRDDRHLLGTYGYAAAAPGYNADPDSWPHGVLYIEDTTDYLRDWVHGEYVARAGSYAEAYNRVILSDTPTPPQTSPHRRSPG